MGNMGGMLKQVQKMQEQIARAQEEVGEIEVEATAGGGAVSARANGNRELLEIKIKPDAIDPDDVEMLEDMVLAAVNEALRQAGEKASEHMQKAAGPLQGMLPPGMKLPGM
ncbi:MAG: YbaB/EbfC family nucleoid-associated protein [bacterium]